MGQGSDSIGFDEWEYDEYEEGLLNGMWTQRNGEQIKVRHMSLSHLYGARSVAGMAALRANCEYDEEKWNKWVDIFDAEIESRRLSNTTKSTKQIQPIKRVQAVKNPTRGEKVSMTCQCGKRYQARKADVARGWGLSCSKSCAAIRREKKC